MRFTLLSSLLCLYSFMNGASARKNRLNDRHISFAKLPLKPDATVIGLQPKDLRGGAASAGNLVATATVAGLEAGSLLGVLAFGREVADSLNNKVGSIVSKVISILLVVFGSSLVGSVIQGGMKNAAASQFFDPNSVPGDPNWYVSLKKPTWNPPGWLFPIMWLIVSKPTQCLALYNLLAKEQPPWAALSVYTSHLALGDAWNKVFFGMQDISRGLAVITLFYIVLIISTFLFYQIDPQAGKFMLPTCAWVTVASALNLRIYQLNKTKPATKPTAKLETKPETKLETKSETKSEKTLKRGRARQLNKTKK